MAAQHPQRRQEAYAQRQQAYGRRQAQCHGQWQRPQQSSGYQQPTAALPPVLRAQAPYAPYQQPACQYGYRRQTMTERVASNGGQIPARQYAVAGISGGAIGTVIAVVVALLIGGYPAMMARRVALTHVAVAAEGRVGWRGSNPPISWSLLDEGTMGITRAAVMEDIEAMLDPDTGFGILSWPSVPYFVGEGRTSDCTGLMNIVDGIYSDYPELSVYTNGQCVETSSSGARYKLNAAGGVSPEENRAEYDAVVSRLDELARECDEIAGDDDALYVREAYRRICDGCVYSPDSCMSPHANDIYGALIEGNTKCYGGSCALKGILDRRGIPSFVACGQMHGDPSLLHAWNVLWLGGRWIVCDTTSSMDSDIEQDGEFRFFVECLRESDEYLATEDMMMAEPCKRLMEAYEKLVGAKDGGDQPFDDFRARLCAAAPISERQVSDNAMTEEMHAAVTAAISGTYATDEGEEESREEPQEGASEDAQDADETTDDADGGGFAGAIGRKMDEAMETARDSLQEVPPTDDGEESV